MDNEWTSPKSWGKRDKGWQGKGYSSPFSNEPRVLASSKPLGLEVLLVFFFFSFFFFLSFPLIFFAFLFFCFFFFYFFTIILFWFFEAGV